MSEDTTLDEFANKDGSTSNEPEKPELIQGVAWSTIDSIPDNWTVNNIESDIEILAGNNFSSDYFTDEDGIPLIRIRDLAEDDTTVYYNADYDSKYLISQQDLLVGMDGEFEPHLWAGPQALLNQRVCKITPNERYNKIFFRYAIEKPLFYIQKSIAGTTVKHLSQSNINDLNLPTPSLEQQRKIATVLYNVDQAIQKTNDIIDNLEDVLVGTRRNLMRKGVRNSQLSESDSRFGKIPEVWNIRRLNSVSDVIGGSTPSTDEPEYWGENIPWATPTDLTELEDTVISGTNDYITEKGLNSTSTNLLPPQSVLMTSRATIGECAVNTVEMATNQGFQSLVPGESLDTWYLYYRMEEEASYLESVGSGSTFSEVSNTTVQKIQIPVPPISEQREIAEKLKSIEKSRLSEQEYYKRLKRLKRGLMQDLLSGTVRTTDTNIEIPDEIAQHG